MFRILKNCCFITCLVTLLSYCPIYNVAEAFFLLFCWDVPNLETLPTYTLSCYIAELFAILKHCWCIPCLITLLKSSQSWNIAVVLSVLLHCWAIPNLKTLLMYTLSYYIAKKLSILKHCRRISCLLHCWSVLNLKTLLIYSVCYDLAELYPILVHCPTLVYLNTLLSAFTLRCRQPIRIEDYVTQRPRELSTKVQVPTFYDRLERVDYGIAQQCDKTDNTTAIFQDWELFSNVIKQRIHQQCFKIGNSSAMYQDRVYVGSVSRLGTSQQNNKKYASATL